MNKHIPPPVKRDPPYDTVHLASQFALMHQIANKTHCIKYGFTAVIIHAHALSTDAFALKAPTCGLIGFLRQARVIGDSGWLPGQIAATVTRHMTYSEVLPLPDAEQFFGRDGKYAQQYGCEWGLLIWNLAASTLEAWGDGAMHTFGNEGMDAFPHFPLEPKHGEW